MPGMLKINLEIRFRGRRKDGLLFLSGTPSVNLLSTTKLQMGSELQRALDCVPWQYL